MLGESPPLERNDCNNLLLSYWFNFFKDSEVLTGFC